MDQVKLYEISYDELVALIARIANEIISERLGTKEQQIEGLRIIINQELNRDLPTQYPGKTKKNHTPDTIRNLITSHWTELIDEFVDKPFTVRRLSSFLLTFTNPGDSDLTCGSGKTVRFQSTVTRTIQAKGWNDTVFTKTPFIKVAHGEYCLDQDFINMDI